MDRNYSSYFESRFLKLLRTVEELKDELKFQILPETKNNYKKTYAMFKRVNFVLSVIELRLYRMHVAEKNRRRRESVEFTINGLYPEACQRGRVWRDANMKDANIQRHKAERMTMMYRTGGGFSENDIRKDAELFALYQMKEQITRIEIIFAEYWAPSSDLTQLHSQPLALGFEQTITYIQFREFYIETLPLPSVNSVQDRDEE